MIKEEITKIKEQQFGQDGYFEFFDPDDLIRDKIKGTEWRADGAPGIRVQKRPWPFEPLPVPRLGDRTAWLGDPAAVAEIRRRREWAKAENKRRWAAIEAEVERQRSSTLGDAAEKKLRRRAAAHEAKMRRTVNDMEEKRRQRGPKLLRFADDKGKKYRKYRPALPSAPDFAADIRTRL